MIMLKQAYGEIFETKFARAANFFHNSVATSDRNIKKLFFPILEGEIVLRTTVTFKPPLIKSVL